MIFKKPKRQVNKVFLHCSANSNPKWGIEDLKESHILRGFTDIGYHYFIDFTGKIWKGRDIETTPAAQQKHNTGTIAICLHGGQNSICDFTQEQYESLFNLCDTINSKYNNITFHGHKEVESGKDCPVFDYKKILNLDKEGFVKKEKTVSFRDIREENIYRAKEPTFFDFIMSIINAIFKK